MITKTLKSTMLLVLALAMLPVAGIAQKHSKWTSQMLDYKHKMLVEEVGMTDAQQKQFLPLYKAMEQEIYQVNKDARDKAKRVAADKKADSDEYGEAAEALSKTKTLEGQIESKYYEKFEKILTPKQMFLLKQAEAKFTRYMLTSNKKSK